MTASALARGASFVRVPEDEARCSSDGWGPGRRLRLLLAPIRVPDEEESGGRIVHVLTQIYINSGAFRILPETGFWTDGSLASASVPPG